MAAVSARQRIFRRAARAAPDIQPGLAAALVSLLPLSVACHPTGDGYCFSDEWDSADQGVVFIKPGVADPRESLHCWCPDEGQRDPPHVECSPVGASCFPIVYTFDFPASGSQLIRSRYSDNVYELTPVNLEDIRAACYSDTGDSGAAP